MGHSLQVNHDYLAGRVKSLAQDNWQTYVLQMPAALQELNPNCTVTYTDRCWELLEDSYKSDGFWGLVGLEAAAAAFMLLQLWSSINVVGKEVAAHRIKEYLDLGLLVVGAAVLAAAVYLGSFVSTNIGRTATIVLAAIAFLLLVYSSYGIFTTGCCCSSVSKKLPKRHCGFTVRARLGRLAL